MPSPFDTTNATPTAVVHAARRVVYTPDEEAALRQRVLDWTALPEQRGGFTFALMKRAFKVAEPRLRALKDALVEEGILANRGHQRGLARTDLAPAGTVTIDALHALAVRSASATAAVRGRRKAGEGAAVHEITPTQLIDVKGVLALFAEGMFGSSHATNRPIAPEFLVWDDSAGMSGAGDWAITKPHGKVVQWSNARANRKGRTQNTNVSKHIGSARLILNLAATSGLIPRADRHESSFDEYAGSWQADVEQMMDEVCRALKVATDSRRVQVDRGVRALAIAATKQGFRDRAGSDWCAVRDGLEAAVLTKGSIATCGADEVGSFMRMTLWPARKVWLELREVKENGWTWERGKRIGDTPLVPASALKNASLKRLRDRSFDGWECEGERLTALIDGHYGLDGWINWVSLPKHAVTAYSAASVKLPKRERTETGKQKHGERPKKGMNVDDPFSLKPVTLRGRLSVFNRPLGWFARQETTKGAPRYDFARTHDLRVLVDVEGLERWAKAVTADLSDHAAEKHEGVSRVAFAAATLASPYLEARARQLGDEALAQQMLEARDQLVEMGKHYAVATKKIRKEIAMAWQIGDRPGWFTILDLIKTQVADMERKAGMPIDEVPGAIRAGTFIPSFGWSSLNRTAALLIVTRRIPLRARTVSDMLMSDWENITVAGRTPAADLKKWEGAIRLNFGGDRKIATKANREFVPHLISPKHVGVEMYEEGIVRSVLECYVMERGSRDRLLTRVSRKADGTEERTVLTSDYVFVAAAQKGSAKSQSRRGKEGYRLDPRSHSEALRRAVIEYGPTIGLNLRALTNWGAMTLHVLRLLFGTYWAPRNLFYASKLLHHKSLDITAKLYCGTDEGDFDAEARWEG